MNATEVKPLTVDTLAQAIRIADGSNELGAGALAEALLPFILSALPETGGGFAEGRPAILGEIERGLEGVTEGPWAWQTGAFHSLQGPTDALFYYTINDDGVWCNNDADEAHLARMSPDNWRAILTYIASLESLSPTPSRSPETEGMVGQHEDLPEYDPTSPLSIVIHIYAQCEQCVRSLNGLPDRSREALLSIFGHFKKLELSAIEQAGEHVGQPDRVLASDNAIATPAALRAQPTAGEGWQPIDDKTPRDENPILLANCFRPELFPYVGYWKPDSRDERMRFGERGCWQALGGGTRPPYGPTSPTHWQPLPAAPGVRL